MAAPRWGFKLHKGLNAVQEFLVLHGISMRKEEMLQ